MPMNGNRLAGAALGHFPKHGEFPRARSRQRFLAVMLDSMMIMIVYSIRKFSKTPRMAAGDRFPPAAQHGD
jgi:hypothetical protein